MERGPPVGTSSDRFVEMARLMLLIAKTFALLSIAINVLFADLRADTLLFVLKVKRAMSIVLPRVSAPSIILFRS